MRLSHLSRGLSALAASAVLLVAGASAAGGAAMHRHRAMKHHRHHAMKHHPAMKHDK